MGSFYPPTPTPRRGGQLVRVRGWVSSAAPPPAPPSPSSLYASSCFPWWPKHLTPSSLPGLWRDLACLASAPGSPSFSPASPPLPPEFVTLSLLRAQAPYSAALSCLLDPSRLGRSIAKIAQLTGGKRVRTSQNTPGNFNYVVHEMCESGGPLSWSTAPCPPAPTLAGPKSLPRRRFVQPGAAVRWHASQWRPGVPSRPARMGAEFGEWGDTGRHARQEPPGSERARKTQSKGAHEGPVAGMPRALVKRGAWQAARGGAAGRGQRGDRAGRGCAQQRGGWGAARPPSPFLPGAHSGRSIPARDLPPPLISF